MALFIRVQTSFWTHRKTMRLRARLGDVALWLPPRLWSYAAENQPDGDFTKYSAEELAMLVGCLTDAQAMLQALQDSGFMDGMKIHDWHEHNGYHEKFAERAKKAAAARWKGQEKKVQDRKGQDKSVALLGDAKSNATSIPTEKKPESCESFLTFWTAYPRREGKGKAEESWKKMGCTAILAQILKAVEAAKTTEQWKKDNGQFIPMPATWLNQKRWEDEPATAPAKPAASYYLPGVGMVNAK